MEPILEALEWAAAWLARERPAGETRLSGRVLDLVHETRGHPGAEYYSVQNRLTLVEAGLHVYRRDWDRADAAIAPLVFFPYRACDDMASVRTAMLLDRTIRPNQIGSLADLAVLSMERLLFLISRFPSGHDRLDLIEAFGPQLANLLQNDAVARRVVACCGAPDDLPALFAASLLYLRVRRPWPSKTLRPARLAYRAVRGRPFRRFLAAICRLADTRTSFALSPAIPTRRAPPRPASSVLITRGMGGVGDVMMMLPGIVALAKKQGAPVHFAMPRRMMPLASGHPEIVPLAVQDEIAVEDYAVWRNFGECPAGRVEGASVPHVRDGRVAIFAAAIGVTQADLDRTGWTVRPQLDAAQIEIRDRLRAAASADGRPVLGIAPFSREEYRRATVLVEVAKRLSGTHRVLVLHEKPLPALRRAGLRLAETPDLSSLVATIAACDYVVSIDTAQLHIAGALGVPCLGIFGPTDGRLRTQGYASVRVFQPVASCPLMPCWRNEDQACALSRGPESVCLTGLHAEPVLDAFARLTREFPTVHVAEPPRAALATA